MDNFASAVSDGAEGPALSEYRPLRAPAAQRSGRIVTFPAARETSIVCRAFDP